MELELQQEKYQSMVLDKANQLDLEPIFVNQVVETLAKGLEITDDSFLKSYFISLVPSIMEDIKAGLRSRRPELKEYYKQNNEIISKEDLQLLSPKDRGVLVVNVAMMPGDGEVRYGHLLALEYANDDLERIQKLFNVSSITELIEKKFSKEFVPIVTQYKALMAAHLKANGQKINPKTGQLVKAKRKPGKWKRK